MMFWYISYFKKIFLYCEKYINEKNNFTQDMKGKHLEDFCIYNENYITEVYIFEWHSYLMLG